MERVRVGVISVRVKKGAMDLNSDRNTRGEETVRRQGEGRRGWWEYERTPWSWMQTDRQGNQRQAVTFPVVGGSKALFKGPGQCWVLLRYQPRSQATHHHCNTTLHL